MFSKNFNLHMTSPIFLQKTTFCTQNISCDYKNVVRMSKCSFKGTLMQIQKSVDICLHMKTIRQRFHIITPFPLQDMCTGDMGNVCLQAFRNCRIC